MPGIRRGAPLLAALLAALVAAPAAQAGNTFKDYTLKTAGTLPSHAATGPDGRLWVTSTTTPGRLSAFDVFTGTWAEYGTADNLTDPYDLVAGPDGAIWFTELGGHVGRSTVDGVVTEYPMAGTEPRGIAAGPDGALWVALHSADAVARVSVAGATTGTWPLPAGSGPEDIAVGPDGALWFTELHGGRIGRITTGGVLTEYPLPDPASEPSGIVAGPDGAMWFVEQAGVGRVGRIDVDTKAITEYPLPVAGQRPAFIAAGVDGNLWVTENGTDGAVDRVAVDGTIERFAGGGGNGFAAGLAPVGITSGPDGNIWFVQSGGAGNLVRVLVAPGVKTLPAVDLTDTTATLRGLVRGSAQPTTYRLEYGTTTAYGNAIEGTLADSNGTERQVSAAIAGLLPETTYHFRLVASNGAGTAKTKDRTFMTAPAPPAPVQDPLAGAPGPALPVAEPGPRPEAPRLGRSVGVAPVSGTVRIRDAAGRAIALGDDATIPTGSVVDTRSGTVELTTALDASGRVQKGRFWGGVFEVRQPAGGRGMTELVLRGGSFAGCGAGQARARAAARRPPRSLWGSDSHGRFRTRGRGSVATVRGTRWLTEDRCEGTLTRVAQGAVAVRDLHRKKTVLVKAGRSYLARVAR
jgi:streptogramin lyase